MSKQKNQPFWELNLNPITMLPPVRYKYEECSSELRYSHCYPQTRENPQTRTKVRTFIAEQSSPIKNHNE